MVNPRPVHRVAFRPDEAAASLGVSRSEFYRRVLPELRTVLVGRSRLAAMARAWLEREARRLGAVER